MKRPAGQQGFTLVELLVAATIMALILSALGSLFVSTNRAYRANDEVSERQQSADAAAQLLSYEIGLAGYRGSTPSNVQNSTFAATERTLSITKGASATTSDAITVRYYEDRFNSSPVKTMVTFNAAKDGNNIFNLYRHNHAETAKQPAIQFIQNLKVLSYIRKDGSEGASATQATLSGLRLELTFTDGLKKQVVIGIDNPQANPELPTL